MDAFESVYANPLIASGATRTLPSITHTTDEAVARRVAGEYESVFLAQILDVMFAGIETDGMFGGGHAETIYRSLLNQEYAGEIAKSGGIGVADTIMREILQVQEVS
jgi:Rod binding domain-containing protein